MYPILRYTFFNPQEENLQLNGWKHNLHTFLIWQTLLSKATKVYDSSVHAFKTPNLSIAIAACSTV